MKIAGEIKTVEAHACGEHGRVIVSGVAEVRGDTAYEKMVYLRTHADGLRLRMLREPRGYPAAKMATLHARGQLPLNHDFRHAGVLGTVFTGRLKEETTVGPYDAVVPSISGRAWITGTSTYTLDPSDPFPEGFVVGDIW